jgi:Ca2+-binding RTX toxin-like protein
MSRNSQTGGRPDRRKHSATPRFADAATFEQLERREMMCGGNDVHVGGGNKDVLIGEGGNDTLVGGGGNDRMFGGPGVDKVFGGHGSDSAEDSDQDLVDFQVEKSIAHTLEGRRKQFTEDTVEFGIAYAQRAREDHRLFVEAFRENRIGVSAT